MTKTRPYRIWRNIKDRCNNKNNKDYRWYGGRGITICDQWLDFATFWNDVKEGYNDTLSIDRIDNTKGYEPGNCRWATMKTQQNNRRNNITYKGENAWQASIRLTDGANPRLIYNRIKSNWPLEKAFTQTPQKVVAE
jgi:hypothetical protein